MQIVQTVQAAAQEPQLWLAVAAVMAGITVAGLLAVARITRTRRGPRELVERNLRDAGLVPAQRRG